MEPEITDGASSEMVCLGSVAAAYRTGAPLAHIGDVSRNSVQAAWGDMRLGIFSMIRDRFSEYCLMYYHLRARFAAPMDEATSARARDNSLPVHCQEGRSDKSRGFHLALAMRYNN